MNNLKPFVVGVLAFLLAYGVFWSYSIITIERQAIQILVQQRDLLASQIKDRCEVQLVKMGYQVVPKPVEQPPEEEKQAPQQEK